MHGNDFSELVGVATAAKSAFFGCTLPTLRRWISGETAPPAGAIRLAKVYFGGDLSALFGREWSEIEVSTAGLHLPGWRYPVPVGELRAQFWRSQQVTGLELELERARRDLERESDARIAAEDRAEFYRHQVQLEARLGMALARIGA